MNRLAILTIISIILFAAFASAESNLSINPTTVTMRGVAGFSAERAFSLKNTGAADLSAISISATKLLGASENISASAISFNDTSLSLYGGNRTDIRISVNIPSDTPAGSYSGLIVKTSEAGSDNNTLTLTVDAVSASFTTSSLDLGNLFPNASIDRTITITNDGNVPLTGISAELDAPSEFNFLLNATSIGDLDVGESAKLRLSGRIPGDQRTVPIIIGKINLSSAETSEAFSINANIMGRLEITDFDVIVDRNVDNERASDDNLNNNEKIDEDAQPGATVTLDIEVRNLYTDEEDIDMEDVRITATIKDIDDGDDIEEESEKFDLDPEDDNSEIVEIKLPMFVDEGEYDIDILVEGRDSNGNDHALEWTVILDIGKRSHDVRIYDYTLVPSILRCQQRTTRLSVELANFGDDDEEEVRFTASNDAIGLSFEERDIELDVATDRDEIYQSSIPIVIPQSLNPGTYPITINAYFDENVIDDQQTINLVVQECISAAPEEPDEDENDDEDQRPAGNGQKDDSPVVIVPAPGNTIQPPKTLTPPTNIPTTVEKPFFESNAFYIIALGGNFILLLVFVVIVAVIAFRNKRRNETDEEGGEIAF